jgi:hypothetical protein
MRGISRWTIKTGGEVQRGNCHDQCIIIVGFTKQNRVAYRILKVCYIVTRIFCHLTTILRKKCRFPRRIPLWATSDVTYSEHTTSISRHDRVNRKKKKETWAGGIIMITFHLFTRSSGSSIGSSTLKPSTILIRFLEIRHHSRWRSFDSSRDAILDPLGLWTRTSQQSRHGLNPEVTRPVRQRSISRQRRSDKRVLSAYRRDAISR